MAIINRLQWNQIDAESSKWSAVAAEIGRTITVESFWQRYLGKDFKIGMSASCPLCSTMPGQGRVDSFQVYAAGGWRCFNPECAAEGEDITDFWGAANKEPNREKAAYGIYCEFVMRPVDDRTIERHQQALLELEKGKGEILGRLLKEYGITYKTMEALLIGWSDKYEALAVPLFNHLDLCTNIAMVRPFGQGWKVATTYAREENPWAVMWPMGRLLAEEREGASFPEIVVTDAILDAMVGLSNGVVSVAMPGPTTRMPHPEMMRLKGRKIIIAFRPGTDDGRVGATCLADELLRHSISDSVKIVSVDAEGLGDYLHSCKHTAEQFRDLCRAFPLHTLSAARPGLPEKAITVEGLKTKKEANEILLDEAATPQFITLKEAVDDRWFNRMWTLEASVVGSDTDTMKVPRRVQVECKSEKTTRCEGCPLCSDITGAYVEEFDMYSPDLPDLVGHSSEGLDKFIRKHIGVPRKCVIKCQTLSTFTVSYILVAPPIGHFNLASDVFTSQIPAYFFSSTVKINAPYRFTGYTSKDSNKGRTMLVFIAGEPISMGIDSFEATEDIREQLRSFQVPEGTDLFSWLTDDFYGELAENVTRIRGRPLTHMAIDLAFHAPNSFNFAGEYFRKTGLDILIVGDTACGKTRISKSLLGLYEFGEIVSGENISFMNLVGGVKPLSGYRGICWGKFPQLNRGLLVVDEMSALPVNEFGRLTDIRDSGMAQVEKIGVAARTNACTTTIWLSNTAEGQPLSTYRYPVLALTTLVKSKEDIRRFTYVHAVDSSEVSIDEINQQVLDEGKVKWRYSPAAAHNLVMWCKSRNEQQITFTNEAVQEVFKWAKVLSAKYDIEENDIPLLLPAIAKKKIAQVAAAVAGRIYSCDPTGEMMVVDVRCVRAAVAFLEFIYDSDSLGYAKYAAFRQSEVYIDEDMLADAFNRLHAATGIPALPLMKLFRSAETITSWDIKDWIGDDGYQARQFLQGIFHSKALKQVYGGRSYKKTDRFHKWLEKHIQRLETKQ